MDGRERRAGSGTVRMKAKVCLVGEGGVGKTSLIRRYVLDLYADRYVETIGTKVSRKEVVLRLLGGPVVRANLLIWDIMGAKGFRALLQEAYFQDARGVLAVADLTRRSTLLDLDGWLESVIGVTGVVPVLILGNKADLRDDGEIGPRDLEDYAAGRGCPHLVTSARTGENVEEAFRRLATMVAENVVAGRSPARIGTGPTREDA